MNVAAKLKNIQEKIQTVHASAGKEQLAHLAYEIHPHYKLLDEVVGKGLLNAMLKHVCKGSRKPHHFELPVPTVHAAEHADGSAVICGKAAPGSTVLITAPDGTHYTGTTNHSGVYTVTIPAEHASTGNYTAVARDAAGHQSCPASVHMTDTVAPNAPTVDAVGGEDGRVAVIGQAEAGSKVVVTTPDNMTYSVTADSSGHYTVMVPAEHAGAGNYTAVAVDASGNQSASATSSIAVPVHIDSTVVVDNAHAQIDISGVTTGVAAGSVVTIEIHDRNYNPTEDYYGLTLTATVQADGTYSLQDIDVRSLADGPLSVSSSTAGVTDSDSAVLDKVLGSVSSAVISEADGNLSVAISSTEIITGTAIAVIISDSEGHTVTATTTAAYDGNNMISGIDVSSLTDGMLTIITQAVDSNGVLVNSVTTTAWDAVAGNIASSVEVDNAHAQIDISGSTVDVAAGSAVTLIVSDSAGHSITLTTTVGSDGHYSTADIDVSGLTDGVLSVESQAVDHNGKIVRDSDQVVLDAVAGSVASEVLVNNERAQVAITGSSISVPGGAAVTLVLTDSTGHTVTATATVGSDGHYSVSAIDVSSLTQGRLTVHTQVTDNNGVVVQDNDNVVLGKIPPTIDSTVAVDNAHAQIDISGVTTGVDAGSVVTIEIHDRRYDPVDDYYGMTVTATVQADGTYSLQNVDASSLLDGPLSVFSSTAGVTDLDNAVLDKVLGSVSSYVSSETDGKWAMDISTNEIKAGAEITITISDSEGHTVTVTTYDGLDYIYDIDVRSLTDGTLTITTQAVDSNGVLVSSQTTRELDLVASSINGSVEVDNTHAQMAVSGSTVDVAAGSVVTLTVSDSIGHTVTATATLGSDGHYRAADIDVSSLADGVLSVASKAVDHNGKMITDNDSVVLEAVTGTAVSHAVVDNAHAQLAISGTTTDVPEGSAVVVTVTDSAGHTVTATSTVDAQGRYAMAAVDVSSLMDGNLKVSTQTTDINHAVVRHADDTVILDTVASSMDSTVVVDNAHALIDIIGTTHGVPAGSNVAIEIRDQRYDPIDDYIGTTLTTTVQADGSYRIQNINANWFIDGPLTILSSTLDASDSDKVVLDKALGSFYISPYLEQDGSLSLYLSSKEILVGTAITITVSDSEGHTLTQQAGVNYDDSSMASFDVSSLTDGTLTITVSAVDSNGVLVSSQASTELDLLAGSIASTVEVDNAHAQIDVSGSTVDVGAGSAVTLTVSDSVGHTVTLTTTVGSDGHYSVADIDVSSLAAGQLNVVASSLDHNHHAVSVTQVVVLADAAVAIDAVAGLGGDLAVQSSSLSQDMVATIAVVGSGEETVSTASLASVELGQTTVSGGATDATTLALLHNESADTLQLADSSAAKVYTSGYSLEDGLQNLGTASVIVDHGSQASKAADSMADAVHADLAQAIEAKASMVDAAHVYAVDAGLAGNTSVMVHLGQPGTNHGDLV